MRQTADHARLALVALALGGFGIGLTEFSIVGLLPEIAADFVVDEAAAGFLVTGYALSVAIGGVAITIAVTRLDRKRVLLALMSLFVIGNLMSGLAPAYGAMLAGRVVAALCHGAFFGIGAVLAADIVAPAKRASAISIMFGGLTLANVLGVPLGTWLGQSFGWRSTFVVISGIGVLALLGILVLVPGTSGGPEGAPVRSMRDELRVFSHGQLWLSLVVTALGFGGMFGGFTYIAYTLTEVSGIERSAVPLLLLLFGGGLFVGNLIGARMADRRLDATLIGLLSALSVILAVFALTAANPVAATVCLVLMGAVGFATVPGLQLRVLSHASAAPTLASGSNIAAFNLGNALGAWVGGLTITAGLGYTSPLWDAAVITLLALAVLLVARFAASRRTPALSQL